MNNRRFEQSCETIIGSLAGKDWVGAMELADEFRRGAKLSGTVRLLARIGIDTSLADFYSTVNLLEDAGVIEHIVDESMFRSYRLTANVAENSRRGSLVIN